MKIETDIDIDVFNRDKVLEKLSYVCAKIKRDDGTYDKHNTGVYFQDIPFDPFTQMASLDVEQAEELGYFKLDLLNVYLYENVRDEQHLIQLLNTEPMWELLEHKEFVEQLFHINKYHSLLSRLKPKSIDDLAMILAIIRPGKKHLMDRNWDKIKREVWVKPKDDSYFFKKSHSYGYAAAIIVQMNLIVEESTKS